MSKTPLYWNKAKKYLSQKDKTMSSLIKKYKSPSETVLTSRKDVRDTVTSSKSGFNQWNGLTPYTRMQILYRLSEMIEGNKESYIILLQDHGLRKNEAKNDIENSINTIIWYAGLVDKWEQLTGNLNPVAGEYFNISHQEPIGVTFTLNSNSISLDDLVKSFLPALTVGCSVINFSEKNAVIALKLSEDINNSDFPAGSLNIIAGKFENIVEDVGGHVEIKHAVIYDDISKESKTIIGEKGSESVKRISFQPPTIGLSSILPFIETKTVWHPKGK